MSRLVTASRFAAALSLVLLAFAVGMTRSARAQSSQPNICGNPPCYNPPPTITWFSTPGSGTIDTTSTTWTATVTSCNSVFASDSVYFNGTRSSAFTFSFNASGCEQASATLTLATGTNTLVAYGCSGNTGNNIGTCTSAGISVAHPAVAVTTLNTTLNAGVTYDTLQIFFIHNYTTTTATDTLTVACSGSGVSSCPTKRFVTVTPGTSVPDTVRFASGALNTTGTIQLTATSGSNSASATVNETSVWTSYATVSTAYTNAGDQDMTRCAVGCFAATATVSTVPYISRDTPRSVSLRYLGDRVAMRPFLIADVTLPANVPYTALWFQLSAAIKIGGAWTNVQFVNGDQTITFTGSGAQAGVPYRLAGAFDASTYPTGVYPVALTVSVVDSTHAEAHVDTLHLLIVNGRKYPVARGWSVAGVSRLYSSADTTLVGIDEGNG